MSEVDLIYSEARQYAEQERQLAIEEAEKLDIQQLRKEYVDLMAMVAYYTKLERSLSATPRLQFDALRKALNDIDADEILHQAALAEEDGVPLGQYARVKAKPLITLLTRVSAMLPSQESYR